jgi:hypothetical protein
MTLAALIKAKESLVVYLKEVATDTKVLFGLRKHLNNFYRRDGTPYNLTPDESTAIGRSPTLYKQICEGL